MARPAEKEGALTWGPGLSSVHESTTTGAQAAVVGLAITTAVIPRAITPEQRWWQQDRGVGWCLRAIGLGASLRTCIRSLLALSWRAPKRTTHRHTAACAASPPRIPQSCMGWKCCSQTPYHYLRRWGPWRGRYWRPRHHAEDPQPALRDLDVAVRVPIAGLANHHADIKGRQHR